MREDTAGTYIQDNCESINSKSVGDDVSSTAVAAVADVLPLSLH